MKCNVLPADTFLVLNKTILTEQDRKIIILLYQPIIGGMATSLYFTLWSYLDKSETKSLELTHHHLMTSLGFKLEDVVVAREKLEGIGLLKTYVKKDNIRHFIYELYSPLSPKEFIENPILNTTLYNNVGKIEYDNVTKGFKIPRVNLKDYEEITMLFRDVYDISDQNLITYEQDYIEKNKGKLFIEETVDLQSVFSLIPEELFNVQSVHKETKELIYKLCFVYNLDEDELLSILKNSLTGKRTIDVKLLRQNARNYYEFENSGKLPSIVYKNQPEYLRKPVGDTSKRAKMIYVFETTSPYAFLASKYKEGRPPKGELAILETLAVDFKLKPGVINVLIDYVLKINNNKLTKKYVEAIAAQWKKANIETVEDAMKFAEKEYKGRRKVTKKIEEKPDWFNQDIKSVKASKEEIDEIEKLLEGF